MGISPQYWRSVLKRRPCGIAALSLAAALFAAGRTTVAQVELDGIVSRVGTRIITRSDVRQARLLKLVDDTGSDDAARRALENRTLVLMEISRGNPLPPVSDADLAAHRREWQATLGGESVDALLSKVAMSEADLQSWLRDDLRIRTYVARQFGSTPDAERPRAVADWMARLRSRASLE